MWRRALSLRLGAPLRELMGGSVRCVCGCAVDVYGFHYGSGCRRGNRGNAWGARHELVNDNIIAAFKRLGYPGAHAVSQNYLGSAAMTGVGVGYVRPDGRLRGFHALDRHVYWDTAVTDPASRAALAAGSDTWVGAGAAARLRSDAKRRKYVSHIGGDMMDYINSELRCRAGLLKPT